MNRIEAFRAAMSGAGIGAALVTRGENLRYLTGFTGEGALLVGESASLFANFLYAEQAEREASGVRVELAKGAADRAGLIRARLGDAGALAIESDEMTVDEFRELEGALPNASFPPLGALLTDLRSMKDEGELRAIRRACEIACEAFEAILGEIRIGMTEREVQVALDRMLSLKGSEGPAFPTIACAGPNGSLPHATPSDRPIREGELLTLDFGAVHQGYRSDMTRTVAIGEVSAELREMYDTALLAQTEALAAIRAGARCDRVDAAAREVIDRKYPGAFGHSLGHGVGLMVHESPGLSSRETRELAAGHVVTVEPGIYIRGVGGCRIEDMGAVTEDGFENMIDADKRLILI